VVVCADTDLDAAASRIATGAFSYAGQSCISVQRVFVEAPVHDAFLERLAAAARKLRVGDPADEATDVGPMISREDAERAEAWIREAVAGGARLFEGGMRDGSLLPPTVLTGTRSDMKVNCLEAFSPLVTVTPFESFESALASVNDSEFGLQAGLFTR